MRQFLARLWRPVGNLLVTANPHRSVKVWLDDLRPAPSGWYWALTAEEAIDALGSLIVSDLSLDHDLGRTTSGYDVVKWLAHQREANGLNFWPLNRPEIHSANPVGRENMMSVIRRYGRYVEDGYAPRWVRRP